MLGKQWVYCCACRSFSQYLSPCGTDTLSDSCREMRLWDIVSWHIAVTDAAHWSGLFPPATACNKPFTARIGWLGISTSSPLWLHTQQRAEFVGPITFHINECMIIPLTFLAVICSSSVCRCFLTLTFLACVSSIAGQAKAEEWINLVDASASIFAWLRLAVINVCEEEKKKNPAWTGGLWILLGLKFKGCILLKRSCS